MEDEAPADRTWVEVVPIQRAGNFVDVLEGALTSITGTWRTLTSALEIRMRRVIVAVTAQSGVAAPGSSLSDRR